MKDDRALSPYRTLKWIAAAFLAVKILGLYMLAQAYFAGGLQLERAFTVMAAVDLGVMIFLGAWLFSMVRRLRLAVPLTTFAIAIPLVLAGLNALSCILGLFMPDPDDKLMTPTMLVLGTVVMTFSGWLYFNYVWKWWAAARSVILAAHQAAGGDQTNG